MPDSELEDLHLILAGQGREHLLHDHHRLQHVLLHCPWNLVSGTSSATSRYYRFAVNLFACFCRHSLFQWPHDQEVLFAPETGLVCVLWSLLSTRQKAVQV